MRRLSLLTILLLAACGGAVYVTPPPVTPILQVISPQEAAGIVYAATNTAAAVATQSAYATGTESSARATSTTGARLTQDSLSVLQTQTVLQLTAGAGAALATNDAAERTATAYHLSALATPAAAAQAAAVRATGTAMARQEAAAERRQSSSEQIWTLFWLAFLGVILIILLALGLAFVFGVSDLLSARAAVHLAAAERARAEAMQLWIFQHGGNIFRLNGSQWEQMPTQAQIAAPLPADEPSQVREVPVRAHGEVIGIVQVGVPETPERARVLSLLMTAQSVAGPTSMWIPSADKLGIHRQEWQIAVNLLKATAEHPAYIMTSPGKPRVGQGGRTRLCQAGYMTVGALLDGVKRGDVLPRPAAPALEPAAGNVPNTHSDSTGTNENKS